MDALQQLPTHDDGLLDIRELTRAPGDHGGRGAMYAQTDMACEGGATARNGYRERGLASLFGDIVQRIPKLRAETYFPEGLNREVLARGPRRRGIAGQRRLDEEDGADRP